MLTKKSIILIALIAVIACVGVMVLVLNINIKRGNEDNSSIGNFNAPETDVEVDSFPGDDYVATEDDEIEYKDYYVTFTNLNVVYEYLTLEATSNICDDTAAYLNEHGYGHVHSLTILEHTVVKEKAYPMFVCSLEGISDKQLEIRYSLEDMQFEYKFISIEPEVDISEILK